MPDRQFSDAYLASLYDACCPWDRHGDYDFYFERVMAAQSVLDVGCGTGSLLKQARAEGHRGRLVGLDPANGMLEQARRQPDVEWIQGDMTSTSFDGEFELVVMTGHAFQVFVKDDDIRANLLAIREALTNDGRFLFETRNPPYRGWEQWTSDNVTEVVDTYGATVRTWNEVELPVTGDCVSFTTMFTSPDWDAPRTSRSTLRFLDAATLQLFLNEAGLELDEQFGNWDRSPLTDVSPEIITSAKRR